jgi:acetyl-CoA carboxylase biotin carboxyl carrier protein
MNPSVDEIKEILTIFLDSELQELRLEIGTVRLAVAKAGATGGLPAFGAPAPRPAGAAPAPVAPAAPVPTPIAAAAPAPAPIASPVPAATAAHEGWVPVTAPSVGTFYCRPAPDQQPFVQVGSHVKTNDPLCLIEVMKMFTGVPAPCEGRIAEILIDDATVVEYGQTLMYIEPA